MTTKSFNENLASLINGGISAGVPLHEVLLTLESAKFEIQFTMFRIAQQKAAQDLASRIIPAGKIDLSKQ